METNDTILGQLMLTTCLNPECPAPLLPSTRICIACGHDNGYPNVRKAESERETLRQRLEHAEVSANTRGCKDRLDKFRERLRKSVAVIATNSNRAHALLSDPSESYTNFYRIVEAGARSPKLNWFDQVRGIADELLFPNYRDYISFGALSINGHGCWYYGSVHLVLAEFAIRKRATVFEGNSLYFCSKRKLGVGSPVPEGYRAAWHCRDELAAVKLEPLLAPNTPDEQLAGILISSSTEPHADFVEVHIYQGLNRYSISRVIARRGGSEDDEIMKVLIKRDCDRANIEYEEVS